MYRKYFGMKRPPFSIAPDPRYLYMSQQHREALAHLLYGIRSDGGFVLLTGEVGTGKTTICRRLLETLTRNIAVAFIIHPTLSVPELLATVCDEFGISYPRRTSTKFLVDQINNFLLDANARRKKAILIIDEAQNLSNDVLEQIRLLTNLETNERKLLQIILIGQPELREKLARPEMKQLAQRIVARCHLGALSRTDTVRYVNHRLAVACAGRARGRDQSSSQRAAGETSGGPGGRAPSGPRRFPVQGISNLPEPYTLFSSEALNSLYVHSRGIPRLINTICDRALLGAFVQRKQTVDALTLERAACEVLGTRPPARNRRWKVALAAAILAGAWVGLLYYFSSGFQSLRIPWTGGTANMPAISRPLPALPRAARAGAPGTAPRRDQPARSAGNAAGQVHE